ncbi:hypothetical protein HNY73_002567 [Argiope bruennichi]|uniref:Uncharacterized protein n=1 Tax=Argiope bruennichi TaxID=94029 RepID=A0A8T0FWN1_ARGBR|nr:hypothetical protein HNY73_002567 [Argiope bruennichi]
MAMGKHSFKQSLLRIYKRKPEGNSSYLKNFRRNKRETPSASSMMKAVLALVLAMAAIACASHGVDIIRHRTLGYDGYFGLYDYAPYYYGYGNGYFGYDALGFGPYNYFGTYGLGYRGYSLGGYLGGLRYYGYF